MLYRTLLNEHHNNNSPVIRSNSPKHRSPTHGTKHLSPAKTTSASPLQKTDNSRSNSIIQRNAESPRTSLLSNVKELNIAEAQRQAMPENIPVVKLDLAKSSIIKRLLDASGTGCTRIITQKKYTSDYARATPMWTTKLTAEDKTFCVLELKTATFKQKQGSKIVRVYVKPAAVGCPIQCVISTSIHPEFSFKAIENNWKLVPPSNDSAETQSITLDEGCVQKYVRLDFFGIHDSSQTHRMLEIDVKVELPGVQHAESVYRESSNTSLNSFSTSEDIAPHYDSGNKQEENEELKSKDSNEVSALQHSVKLLEKKKPLAPKREPHLRDTEREKMLDLIKVKANMLQDLKKQKSKLKRKILSSKRSVMLESQTALFSEVTQSIHQAEKSEEPEKAIQQQEGMNNNQTENQECSSPKALSENIVDTLPSQPLIHDQSANKESSEANSEIIPTVIEIPVRQIETPTKIDKATVTDTLETQSNERNSIEALQELILAMKASNPNLKFLMSVDQNAVKDKQELVRLLSLAVEHKNEPESKNGFTTVQHPDDAPEAQSTVSITKQAKEDLQQTQQPKSLIPTSSTTNHDELNVSRISENLTTPIKAVKKQPYTPKSASKYSPKPSPNMTFSKSSKPALNNVPLTQAPLILNIYEPKRIKRLNDQIANQPAEERIQNLASPLSVVSPVIKSPVRKEGDSMPMIIPIAPLQFSDDTASDKPTRVEQQETDLVQFEAESVEESEDENEEDDEIFFAKLPQDINNVDLEILREKLSQQEKLKQELEELKMKLVSDSDIDVFGGHTIEFADSDQTKGVDVLRTPKKEARSPLRLEDSDIDIEIIEERNSITATPNTKPAVVDNFTPSSDRNSLQIEKEPTVVENVKSDMQERNADDITEKYALLTPIKSVEPVHPPFLSPEQAPSPPSKLSLPIVQFEQHDQHDQQVPAVLNSMTDSQNGKQFEVREHEDIDSNHTTVQLISQNQLDDSSSQQSTNNVEAGASIVNSIDAVPSKVIPPKKLVLNEDKVIEISTVEAQPAFALNTTESSQTSSVASSRMDLVVQQKDNIIAKMKKGAVFIKHHYHTKTTKQFTRAVRLDPGLSFLVMERTGSSLFGKSMKKIQLGDIKWIVYGPHTKNWKTHTTLCPWRCFSIVCSKRTFDFEAATDSDVDIWILGLQSLIHKQMIQNGRPLFTKAKLVFKRVQLKMRRNPQFLKVLGAVLRNEEQHQIATIPNNQQIAK